MTNFEGTMCMIKYFLIMVKKKGDEQMYLTDNHRSMHTNELEGIVPSWIGDLQNTADKV